MKYTINELANSKGVSQPVRETLLQMEAELDATNKQVEILSDALAESRREVAALKINAALDKKAENARELGLDYEPVWCGHCNGSGRMVRDPDIGTDQECFVCDGAGVPAAPVQGYVTGLDVYLDPVDMKPKRYSAAQPAPMQKPVAWMDGYRNIYSLEEKAAGCEDALIPLVPAIQHWSDCAIHNEPAYPKSDCDCGGYTTPPAAPKKGN